MGFAYDNLKGRIIAKYKTRKAFAEVIGLSENSLSLKLTGKVPISQKEMKDWGELLDIEPIDFGKYFFE